MPPRDGEGGGVGQLHRVVPNLPRLPFIVHSSFIRVPESTSSYGKAFGKLDMIWHGLRWLIVRPGRSLVAMLQRSRILTDCLSMTFDGLPRPSPNVQYPAAKASIVAVAPCLRARLPRSRWTPTLVLIPLLPRP